MGKAGLWLRFFHIQSVWQKILYPSQILVMQEACLHRCCEWSYAISSFYCSFVVILSPSLLRRDILIYRSAGQMLQTALEDPVAVALHRNPKIHSL